MAEYLVDGFLLVQDLYNGNADNSPGTSKLFQNYYVHVGNDPVWSNNPSCPDAPFMTFAKDGSEQSGWIYDLQSDDDVWRYGAEKPCNL